MRRTTCNGGRSESSNHATFHGSEHKIIGPDYCLYQNVGAKAKYLLCKEFHMPQLQWAIVVFKTWQLDSILEILEVGLQLPEWRVTLHLYTCMTVCRGYHIWRLHTLPSQHWVNLKVLDEERQQTKQQHRNENDNIVSNSNDDGHVESIFDGAPYSTSKWF